MNLQQKQKALRSAINSFFWHSSSRYDEEVLDNVLKSIRDNRVNYEQYETYDELAFNLMHREMVRLGHL